MQTRTVIATSKKSVVSMGMKRSSSFQGGKRSPLILTHTTPSQSLSSFRLVLFTYALQRYRQLSPTTCAAQNEVSPLLLRARSARRTWLFRRPRHYLTLLNYYDSYSI